MHSRRGRRIVMLGAAPRTQRSHSSVQLPADFSSATTAVPVFHYTRDDFLFDLRQSRKSSSEERKSLRELIEQRWGDARDKGALNYNLNCMYKFLDGQYNLSIQLNTERGELRRKPMRFRRIQEPFNPVRWNFTRLNDNELLFYLRCEESPLSDDPLDRHLLAVNASPLERNHSLLIPAVNKCHPQVLTASSLRIATDFMLLHDDENHHLLFNSLLGLASVNHLHLHSLMWPYESDIIHRRFEAIPGVDDAFYIQPPQWICQAFAFQCQSREHYPKFLSQLSTCVSVLLAHQRAHNVFFSRAAPIRVEGAEREEDRAQRKPLLVTAYFFPRNNMTGITPTNFNPAANELAGNLTSYTLRFFESASEQSVLRIINEEAVLPEFVFDGIVSDLADALLGKPVAEVHTHPHVDGLTSPELDELRDSFSSFDPPSPSRIGRRRAGSAEQTVIAIPTIIRSSM